MVKHIFLNPRPVLTIQHGRGAMLGNCYSSMTYVVTSTMALSLADIFKIREAGLLGYGQEFYPRYISSEGTSESIPLEIKWDDVEKVSPTGTDIVECSMVDERTGNVIPGVCINPYSKQLVEPIKIPYYVYHCEDRVDSGD